MPELKAPAKPDVTLLDLKDTAAGLQKLATSVEQFPGRMAAEVQKELRLANEVFLFGTGFGFVLGLAFVVVVAMVFQRKS